jgi:uncharacterized membrane protein
MADLGDRAGEDGLAVPKLERLVRGLSNKELMAAARVSLSGGWGMAVFGLLLFGALVCSFLVFVLSIALFAGATLSESPDVFLPKTNAMMPWVSLVLFLVSGALTVGFKAFFLTIAQEGEVQLEKFFVGFQRYWKALVAYFLCNLFVSLWSLLLVIPGVIKSFSYAMAYFILADDEYCGVLEAINRSKEMMKGNKWKFFCLHWRFVGWALLASFFTLGIGYLWLIPYIHTSLARFYEDVR